VRRISDQREHANLWGLFRLGYVLGSRDEGELVAKLVWRVKLVTELEAGETMEVEVARLERDEQAGLADLGLRLAEAKQLMAAIQAEIVPAQVTVAGEHRRTCAACDGELASKGHYTATFRSLFGDVPIRVRRLLTCPCQGTGEAKSFAAFDLEAATVAPELAYVTARYTALAPFGKVADLLSELLPISGAQNAGTVRNRTMRAGEAVVQPHAANTAKAAAAQPAKPVVIGLDGGYVRSRHRQDERHFEVIAGKVIDAQGRQSRFAFARNSPTIASEAFKQALSIAGVTADTPATVLSDGDAGLWRLQRESLPNATVVLDWWHAAVRFEHALQAARGLGAADIYASVLRGGSRTGAGEVAIVARTLVGMPVQTRGFVPLGAPYLCTRRGWHRAPGTPRRRAAGLPRAEPGSAGPLRRPAPEWRTDLDRVRGEFGQRDHCQTHEQEAADALEQGNGATLPRRANNGAERYARGRLPSSLSRLPPCKRRRGNRIGGVMNPTGLHALTGRMRRASSDSRCAGSVTMKSNNVCRVARTGPASARTS
jgi:hypothetical protein